MQTEEVNEGRSKRMKRSEEGATDRGSEVGLGANRLSLMNRAITWVSSLSYQVGYIIIYDFEVGFNVPLYLEMCSILDGGGINRNVIMFHMSTTGYHSHEFNCYM